MPVDLKYQNLTISYQDAISLRALLTSSIAFLKVITIDVNSKDARYVLLTIDYLEKVRDYIILKMNDAKH